MTHPQTRPLRFSVIVSSFGRKYWLQRCLMAIKQLDYSSFEIVVVADEESLASLDGSAIKTVVFDEQNLERSRNLGISHASGDICAFIDDDAVPEPLWLHHLALAFQDPDTAAAVGYVRGRNGISFQSKVHSVDRDSETHLEVTSKEDAPYVPQFAPGRALKLIGTNMAVRRHVFQEIGGFDESYRFYLEDADLSMRLAQAGYQSAVAPLAEVHHAFASSDRRTSRRAPLSLFDVGRSTSIYLAKHESQAAKQVISRVRLRERKRVMRHLILGTCEPKDVKRLMQSLEDGFRDAQDAKAFGFPKITEPKEVFKPCAPYRNGHEILTVRLFLRHKGLKKAGIVAESKKRVTVVSFSLTFVRLKVLYTKTGVWLHKGGQFGPSERTEKWFRWRNFGERMQTELSRVAKVRGIGHN